MFLGERKKEQNSDTLQINSQQTSNQPLREIRAAPRPSTSPRPADEGTSRIEPAERTTPDSQIITSQPARSASEPTAAATGTPTTHPENTRIENEERSAVDFATASLNPRDAEASDIPMYTGKLPQYALEKRERANWTRRRFGILCGSGRFRTAGSSKTHLTTFIASQSDYSGHRVLEAERMFDSTVE